MNSILISLFILFLLIFHEYTKRYMRLGKWKEGLCAAWFMDMVFTVCGIVMVFCFYHYDFVDCRQVEHTVRGTSKRHVCGECISECRLGHNVSRADVFPDKLHYLHTRMLGKRDSGGIDGRNCAVAGKTHAEDFR